MEGKTRVYNRDPDWLWGSDFSFERFSDLSEFAQLEDGSSDFKDCKPTC